MRLHTIWFLLLSIPTLVVCAALPLERRSEYWSPENVKRTFHEQSTAKIPYGNGEKLHGILYIDPTMSTNKLPPAAGILYNPEFLRQPIFVLAHHGFLLVDIPYGAGSPLSRTKSYDMAERALEISSHILNAEITLSKTILSKATLSKRADKEPYDPVYDCARQNEEAQNTEGQGTETVTQKVSSALEELEAKGGGILDNGIGVLNMLTINNNQKKSNQIRNNALFLGSAKMFDCGAETSFKAKGYKTAYPPKEGQFLVLSYTEKGPRVSISGHPLVWPTDDSKIDDQKLVATTDKAVTTPFSLKG